MEEKKIFLKENLDRKTKMKTLKLFGKLLSNLGKLWKLGQDKNPEKAFKYIG